ncbi:MAG: hypothetical protein ACR2PJ_06145, partial [Pseudomonadales bacterium]
MNQPCMKPTIKTLLRKPSYMIALGFGSGLSPFAPGTAGSALALVLALPFLRLPLETKLLA